MTVGFWACPSFSETHLPILRIESLQERTQETQVEGTKTTNLRILRFVSVCFQNFHVWWLWCPFVIRQETRSLGDSMTSGVVKKIFSESELRDWTSDAVVHLHMKLPAPQQPVFFINYSSSSSSSSSPPMCATRVFTLIWCLRFHPWIF